MYPRVLSDQAIASLAQGSTSGCSDDPTFLPTPFALDAWAVANSGRIYNDTLQTPYHYTFDGRQGLPGRSGLVDYIDDGRGDMFDTGNTMYAPSDPEAIRELFDSAVRYYENETPDYYTGDYNSSSVCECRVK